MHSRAIHFIAICQKQTLIRITAYLCFHYCCFNGRGTETSGLLLEKFAREVKSNQLIAYLAQLRPILTQTLQPSLIDQKCRW